MAHATSGKLILKTIANIVHGLDIPLYGQGQQIRDWNFVEDAAEGIFLILNSAMRNRIILLASMKFGMLYQMMLLSLVAEIADQHPELQRSSIALSRIDLAMIFDMLATLRRLSSSLVEIQRHHSKMAGKTLDWYLTHEYGIMY